MADSGGWLEELYNGSIGRCALARIGPLRMGTSPISARIATYNAQSVPEGGVLPAQPVQQGEHVIIVPAVSDEEAAGLIPDGWKTVKPYLRVVPQPTD